MPKPQYGWAHQRARALALSILADGTPCRYCHRPMHKWQRLDLDHIVPVAMGGSGGPTVLVHSRCNRVAGAVMGNRLHGARRRPRARRSLPRW
jgi:HNH endonuclease